MLDNLSTDAAALVLAAFMLFALVMGWIVRNYDKHGNKRKT